MPYYLKQIMHTQFFSIANVISGVIVLFLLMKYMPKIEYGEYILIQSFLSVGGLIISQNLYSYTRLQIPGLEKIIQYGYLKTVLLMVIGLYVLLIFLFSMLNNNIIFDFFEINHKYWLLTLIILGFQLANNEFMRFFISLQKVHINNYANFFQKFFILLFLFILAVCHQVKLKFYLYLLILVNFQIFVYLVYNIGVFNIIKSKIMLDVIKKGYKVGIPLLPVGLMSLALNYTDTLMIAKFIDKKAVAEYGFASQLINIAMMIIGTSIILVLFPYATKAYNQNNIILKTKYFIKMYLFGGFAAILFYLFSTINVHWIFNLLNLNKYSNVPQYLMVLSIFPFFQILYNIASHDLQLKKIITIQCTISIFIILENTILNYFLIKAEGVSGAIFASLISYITLSFIYLIISIKNDSILYTIFRKSIKFIMLTILFVGLLAYLFSRENTFANSLYILLGNLLILFISYTYYYILKESEFI